MDPAVAVHTELSHEGLNNLVAAAGCPQLSGSRGHTLSAKCIQSSLSLHTSPSRSQACKCSPIVLNAIYMLTPPKFMPPGWISPQDSRLVQPTAYLAFLQGCLIASSDLTQPKLSSARSPPPRKRKSCSICRPAAVQLTEIFFLSCSRAPNHEASLTSVPSCPYPIHQKPLALTSEANQEFSQHPFYNYPAPTISPSGVCVSVLPDSWLNLSVLTGKHQ